MKIQLNSRVKLITGKYGESADNPVWKGIFGSVIGTVKKCQPIGHPSTSLDIQVDWDNGYKNSYIDSDLAVINLGEWDE